MDALKSWKNFGAKIFACSCRCAVVGMLGQCAVTPIVCGPVFWQRLDCFAGHFPVWENVLCKWQRKLSSSFPAWNVKRNVQSGFSLFHLFIRMKLQTYPNFSVSKERLHRLLRYQLFETRINKCLFLSFVLLVWHLNANVWIVNTWVRIKFITL